MTPETARWIAVSVLIVVACYTDLTTQKIRNWLTFPTMLLGTCAAFYVLGAWWLGAAGVAVALATTVLPWRAGAIKAGDVKMLMAAGAWIGPTHALQATLWTLILGIPAGIAVLIWKRRLGNVRRVIVEGHSAEATIVAHAPVVAAGILTAMVWDWPRIG